MQVLISEAEGGFVITITRPEYGPQLGMMSQNTKTVIATSFEELGEKLKVLFAKRVTVPF